MLHMTQVTKIHSQKRPVRFHFIDEWSAKRGLRQVDLVRELPVDKSTVSRWFAGSLPKEEHLAALAELFQIEVSALFRHPDDDWIARLLQGRSKEDIAKIA